MRRILVIGTGGTISCAESENGLSPSLSIGELLERVDVPCEIITEQLFSLDSTNITPRHWEQLARLIRERYNEFDGFVITHGTDTMAYAAASLSVLIQNPRKPVVFTGSMKPINAEDSDAPKNLRDAILFAADESAFGVRLVFSGTIFDGRSVTKTASDAPQAFAGKYGGSRKLCGETRFYEKLSDDVFLAKLIPGQRLLVPENARAVILEGYGTGGVPDYLVEEIAALVRRGVYIIIATQCAYGGTDLSRYTVGHAELPLLEAGEMTTEYAVARARLALEYSSDFESFKSLFSISTCADRAAVFSPDDGNFAP